MVFPCIRKFFLHNETQKSEFINYYHIALERIICIPLGCYDIYRNWEVGEVDQTRKTVLFFGRLSPYKGIENFILASQKVSTQVKNVRFVIAGEAIKGYSLPPLPLLQNGCDFELRNDYISVDEQVKLFEQASIVVCPYIEATQSGVVLTAYAFGKPVIATAVGGLPEYVKDAKSGILVEPGDINLLAKAILQVMDSESLQNSLKVGVNLLAQNELNWENIAMKSMDFFQNNL
jgi:glycosyltransferase involved in cell wall biosynthesis